MVLDTPLLVGVMLSAVALVWWAAAPVMVSMGDPRLRERNPLHHQKLVRFYRLWGMMAILVGLVLSLTLR